MRLIRVLAVGPLDRGLLEALGDGVFRELGAGWEVSPSSLDPGFALDPIRQQYHSTEILARLHALPDEAAWRLLGVTGLDLFIPILTFVFGEAQLSNRCALVSTARLRQEFYGLPPDPERLRERLLKETIHELGHTLGLTHCSDYDCVMAASHGVEWIDLKGSSFCPGCRERVLEVNAGPTTAPAAPLLRG
ncbi:MAG: archaemetzincin family Zn-dependent metalloprotease [Candidatus Riflebacteria bacterium]|nr:archaemetzincin family Zn-dependent metalloprotease [Candidatus Riflebacteria bacterium]